MAKPVETELNLTAEVDKYNGEGGGQGDPGKPEYVDPNAKPLEGSDDDADDDDDANDNDDNQDEGDGNDDESGDDGEGDDEADKKPKKGVQKRFDEMTAARREAERQADYWRGRALEAERAKASVGSGEKLTEPDPSKFDYGEADPGYLRALAQFEAQKALDARLVNQAEEQQVQALQGAMAATVSRGRANFADFDTVVIDGAAKGTWDCSDDLAMQLIESEKGDEIAYFLAKNPAEARRLSALPFRSLAREVGKLEVKLENQAEAPAAKPKVVSDAPPPPKRTAKGGSRSGGYDPNAGGYDADFEKWAGQQMNRRR